MKISDAKIVVLGGGTGANVILQALSPHTDNLTAVICMSDNGGSTGKLREQYGVLPPGDIRKSLASMAQIDSEAASVFEHRFSSGDLSGHTVGNIFLAAYELVTGSMTQGVKAMSRLLDLKGTVLPVTDERVDIHYKTPAGDVIEGEIDISYSDFNGDEHPDIYLVPKVSITDDVAKVIAEADYVIIAPGLLYGSLAPVLLTEGLSEAIESSKAELVCVANVTMQKGTGESQVLSEYMSEIERFLGSSKVSHVFANSNMERLSGDSDELIILDDSLDDLHYQVSSGDYRERSVQDVSDTTNVPRRSVRHNPEAIADAILDYIEGKK